MPYAVVRTDLMSGTDGRVDIRSVKYMGADGQTPTAIENGNVLKYGALINGERELRVGSVPAANTKIEEIVLVASPEVMYDERKKNLDEFINEAGKPVRGYRLSSGCIFSVTADALANANPAKDQLIELAASTKWNNVASATNGSTQIGKIIAVDVVGRYTYYVIEVA